MRHFLAVAFALCVASACGCNPLVPTPPGNVAPSEHTALAVLLPIAENASWNKDGTLGTISLNGSNVNDSLLSNLADLTGLWELSLFGSEVTDAGVAKLSRNCKLEALSLQRTRITDSSVAELRILPALSTLDIGHTRISDDSVDVLIELQSLRDLFIVGTRITPEGIAKLRKEMPNCVVHTQ